MYLLIGNQGSYNLSYWKLRTRLKGVMMNYKDLTPEQLDKARACKSAEELVELAKEEGVELTDEQVEFISGGGGDAWNESSDSF